MGFSKERKKIRWEIRSILEMEHRFRSNGIGKSETVYTHLYPNQWGLVNQNEDSSKWWLIESIHNMRKSVISSEISPEFDDVPNTTQLARFFTRYQFYWRLKVKHGISSNYRLDAETFTLEACFLVYLSILGAVTPANTQNYEDLRNPDILLENSWWCQKRLSFLCGEKALYSPFFVGN